MNTDQIRVIAFDADDTLWDCQSHFEEVENLLYSLISPYCNDPAAELYRTESGNMEDLGYGCKAFTISVMETALRVCGNSLTATQLTELLEAGKHLLHLPATPLPEVEKTLQTLREDIDSGKRVVFTKGELQDQENKLKRSGLLKYFDDVSVMQDIAEHLPITEGVDRLMTILKRCGIKIAILSGGFTFFGEYLQRRYGIDYVYANELEIDENGKLTGNYVGEIVDGHRKAELLKLIAQVEKVNLAQTIAVGDGANDLPMISEAGLGIAFHAKPRVVANAEQSINTIGLDGILYFLGFKDSYLGDQGKL